MYRDYEKLKKVVLSCINLEQLEYAKNYCENFIRYHNCGVFSHKNHLTYEVISWYNIRRLELQLDEIYESTTKRES